MRRLLAALPASLALVLLLAPLALAGEPDHGEGLLGQTDDKVITNVNFLVIAFFPLFILVMSVLQWRLEKRKDSRKSASKAREGRTEWRGGW